MKTVRWFLPIDGTYRVIANLALNYLEVLKMNGTSTATLNDDGTGALWIIGDGIGKPPVATNAVGWTTEKDSVCHRLKRRSIR